MSELILLEPFRSAFLVEGYECRLVEITGESDFTEWPEYEAGKSKALQHKVREMALFYPSVQLVHHELPGQAKELADRTGSPTLSALRLIEHGIMTETSVPVDEERLKCWRERGTSIESFWDIEKDNLLTLGPLIAITDGSPQEA